MSELKQSIWPRRFPRPVRPPGRKRRLTLAVLPTLLTLGNGVCGLAAIAVAVSDATLDWPPEQKLFVAGALIFAGMLFDALDGSAARITNQSSRFGGELDSLCDAITFGTAPAVILWRYTHVLPQRLVWAVGVLFTLCVLMRLARFNVETADDDEHVGFEGLPSPAAAGTVAAFVIAEPNLMSLDDPAYHETIRSLAVSGLALLQYVLPVLTVLLAYLMVSRFQYPHIFQQWVTGRRSPQQIGQALFALVGVFLLHELALPLAFCFFAFGAPTRQLAGRFGRWRRGDHGGAGGDGGAGDLGGAGGDAAAAGVGHDLAPADAGVDHRPGRSHIPRR